MQNEKKISYVLIQMLNDFPFFASCVMQMRRRESRQLPMEAPCGVSINAKGITLWVHPDKFYEMSKKEMLAVLEHEVHHVIMQHEYRRGHRGRMKFNVACDIAINQFISGLPAGCLEPETFNLPRQLSAEQYYEMIPDNEMNRKLGQGYHLVDDHSKWGEGKGSGQNKASQLTKDEAEVMVKQLVQEATKSQGSVPSHLKSMIDELMQIGELNWKQVLRRYVATQLRGGKKRSWKRPNRRYGEDFQGIVTDRKLGIVFAIDTSGSMSDKECAEAYAEIKNLQRTYKADLRVMQCDAELQTDDVVKRYQRVEAKVHGRGGTDFRPVFDAVTTCDLLIYFTDMMGTFPDEAPQYAVLWLKTEDYPAPWGREIKMKVQED